MIALPLIRKPKKLTGIEGLNHIPSWVQQFLLLHPGSPISYIVVFNAAIGLDLDSFKRVVQRITSWQDSRLILNLDWAPVFCCAGEFPPSTNGFAQDIRLAQHGSFPCLMKLNLSLLRVHKGGVHLSKVLEINLRVRDGLADGPVLPPALSTLL